MRDKTDTTSEQNDNSSCAGACPNTSVEALVELGQANRYGAIPTVRLFLAKYHTYPNTLECTNNDEDILYHITTVLDYIRDELKHDINQDCVLRRRHQRTKQKYVYSRVTDLGNGIMIEFTDASLDCEIQNPNNLKVDHADNYFLTTEEIKIYYLPKHDVFVDDLSERFSQMTVFSSKSCTLEMVCKNDCGYYLRGIKIKKPLITDLALHYGTNFVSTHDKILTNLNKKESKGIVLLHGIPGSGKTHYIRYLIQEVQDKTLIYIPPDMAKEIASPAFLPFLMEYQDAILIIEDAENIIKDRNESAAPSQAVANLLNLSDGLLGDAMHQQIIATFNCDLTTIDPALLRKGRLIANYEFNKLDLESSKILSDKLGFGRECVNEPMTLAEIYNQNGKNSQLDD
ncbi:unnamed protein product [Adineta steineri]|uniref:ATPase AAA-type core domain-containing protein n=1 Tax=Adineta steineri TaxID=433720 RepID=A0A819B7T1_9BILA|nr:unnamed protein product [Adineta steineri]CAF1048441.1 unnamed protein product [Adineta steineri]CAF3674864.1 unnamed protein product [Adineta steineri]CAF3796455.1 unnamed protein product [Adineta steineri]